METSNKKKNRIRKILKWTFTAVGILLISLFAIPSIFNDAISNEIKKGINKNLETKLQFNNSNISFFTHFPALTFNFEDVNVSSSKPFEKDTLITAKELGFGINVFKLIFSDRVVINETYLTDCKINLIKDKFGRQNYDVFKATDTSTVANDTSAIGLRLNLKKLKIENATIHYTDNDLGINVMTHGLNYNGKGGIIDGKLKLGSNLDITSIDVAFENSEYLKGKTLKAKSFTVYDTDNLSIALDKNTISLNDLKVNFNGNLDIFDQGFAYNLLLKTENGKIKDLISALPPQYAEWSKAVTLNGGLNATLRLTGYTGTVPKASELNHIELEANIYDGYVKHKEADQALENLDLKFKGSLKDNYIDFNLDSLNFTLNEETTKGYIHANGKLDSLNVVSHITSNVDLSILNETLKLPDLEFNGVLAADITLDGVYQPLASRIPKTKGSFELSEGSLQTSGHPEPIKNIELRATADNEGQTYAESSITINKLKFSFLGNTFTSSAFFKNFDQPEYQIEAKGDIDFTTLHQVIELPIIITKGQLKADLSLEGQLNNPQSDTKNTGTLELKNIGMTSKVLQHPVLIKEGQFLFLNEKMALSNLTVQHQSSDLAIDGYFENYLDYALFSNGVLRGDINLKSPKIDITEFFPKEEQLVQKSDSITTLNTVENTVVGVMQVPKNLDLALTIKIDSLIYNSLNITDFSGQLGIKEQGLFLKNSTLKMVDGTSQLSGFYQPISTEDALFSMGIKAQNFNIEKGYNSIELFKELAPAAAQASGIVSIDYNLTGTLDNQMLPVLPALKGKGTLKVHDVKFDGYKLMGKVSEKSGFDALNDPKISEITIHSTLENNVLELEEFKFKVSPFRLKLEGQTTLDGDLSLKMRIGLPPLGLIGIPVVIEGNSDDFDIKLGKKSSDLSTEDTIENSYSEDELNRLSTQKDSIRSGESSNAINKMQQEIKSVKSDSINK
ncbi:AsmA-like C-terminal region-containing protein [Winogradskyella helgolandensis]|uniref:AsmA-like C-terminal region-containing protein n=1 Tax=Winogradskyella helgolandensis TaxID=2697010 RepID=UPI0015BBDA60|nr:AsmA-like C-terminal region-containing protein [Winogradskyella helgolandensis]